MEECETEEKRNFLSSGDASNDVPERLRRESVVRKHCPKCESEKWMTGIKIGGTFGFMVYISQTFVRGSKGPVTVQALDVCADCGYVQAQANIGKEVWEEWRKVNT